MKTLDLTLQRYLDDHMDPSEREAFDARLKSDETLRRELEALQDLRQSLRALPEPVPPAAEPVWQNVQREIRLQEPAESRGFRTWKWAFLAPLTAAAVWLITLFLPASGGLPVGTLVEMVEMRDTDRVPMVYTARETGATVVWLSRTSTGSEDVAL